MVASIGKMFGRSPLRPLQKHMEKVCECVTTLTPFFEAAVAGEWDKARELQINICGLEDEADELKKQMRLNLPTGLFLPVARSDLLTLLALQDRIANKAEDIAGLMTSRRMQLPSKIKENMLALLHRCLDTAEQANKAIHELDELLETGFHGTEVDIVSAMVTELCALEQDTDERQAEIREVLFAMEKDLPPIEVIFLYELIKWLGDLADRAKSVGDYLQLIVAK